MHTMRSAFKRWLILHGEEFRAHGYIRIPSWFSWYIRNNKEWEYNVTNYNEDVHCNRIEYTYENRRRFRGAYSFDISDDELTELQRPKFIRSKNGENREN